MKAVVQRVDRASVTVESDRVGSVGLGLMVLLCVEDGDGDAEIDLFAGKIARMRIFSDDEGKMNRSVLDIGGSVLAISQFTLAADWRRGNRPSFSGAAAPEKAEELYGRFCDRLRELGVPVETGVFAAHMSVDLINDGPVTIWMDSTRN